MRPYVTIGIIFILGVGAGWIASGKYMNVLFSYYVPALATLLAAFYGAKFAFEFQRKKEMEDDRKKMLSMGTLLYSI